MILSEELKTPGCISENITPRVLLEGLILSQSPGGKASVL